MVYKRIKSIFVFTLSFFLFGSTPNIIFAMEQNDYSVDLNTNDIFQAKNSTNIDNNNISSEYNDKEVSYVNTRSATKSGRWIQESNGKWWFRHDDGSYTKYGWEWIWGFWYCFDEYGWMRTGWIQTLGKWYYCNSEGKMQIGWKYIGSKWYYFDSTGAMQTGWKLLENKWYYLDNSGAMQTGWQKIKYPGANGGQAYYNYFNSSGVFMTDSDIQGCSHGYSTISDYRYSSSPKNIKYHSYCSSSQTVQIGIGNASWNSNEVSHISKASNASEANMLYYGIKFTSPGTLASTTFYIDGQWKNSPNKSWTKIKIEVDTDQGTISSGTIAHEVGHALGLSHRITEVNSIMCPVKWGRKVETVQYRDIETLRHIYR